jgi:hypothetical protein
VDHEWKPQTGDELRKQATKLRRLADHVYDHDLCERLRSEAACLDQAARETPFEL